MKLLTKAQQAQLIENGKKDDQDHPPVVKLVTPNGGATWLLSEVDPENPNIAFGLCDLGMGYPELGYVDLEELAELRTSSIPHLSAPVVERDLHFKATYPMSVYAYAARSWEYITTEQAALDTAARMLAERAAQAKADQEADDY